MVALNAVGLTPISALSKPRKPSLLPANHNLPLKSSSPDSSSALRRSFHGGLVLLSSVLSSSSSIAHSLTYEEALQQSMTSSSTSSDNILDSIIGFANDNPLVLAGGAAALALPLLLSQLFSKKPKPFGVETAKAAYAKLGEDGNAQLVDIRGPAELRQVGGPDVRGLGKKPLSIVYKGEDKPGFLKKLALKVKDPENTTLFILDKFDGNSELVAELVTVNGFKAAFAIKDGAEGPRGWTSSGLPWITPKKAFSLDFGSLTDAIGDGSDVLSTALGIAAAAGLGALAFTEVETILQVLGSAALIQFVSKKLLFAEDRKQTIEQVDVFLNTKVAPKELVDEIKQIGKALLPSAVTGKALPAPKPAEATPETVSSETTTTTTETEKIETPPPPPAVAEVAAEAAIATTEEPKVEPVAVEVNSVPTPVKEEEPKVETVAAVEVNSVPTPVKEEVKAEAVAGTPRPQSPYPYYPDLKPPASPSPSQP